MLLFKCAEDTVDKNYSSPLFLLSLPPFLFLFLSLSLPSFLTLFSDNVYSIGFLLFLLFMVLSE